MEARPAAGDLDVALLAAELQPDLARRQAAHDVGEQASRQQHGALLLDLGVGERAGQGQLHVGGAQGQAALAGDDEDAAERRAGCRESRRRGRRAGARRRGNHG